MLVEVQCDKLISYGKVREPIRFKAGLNTVIGDENGSNSVGKSTFLMILDFVFGGKDSVNKCLDVQENVGEHCINFTFEFDGEFYHFSRSNIDYKHVIRCGKDYNPLPEDSQMTIVRSWLRSMEPRLKWLFGKYASVEAQIQQAKAGEDEKDVFKKSKDYKHIRAAKNKTETKPMKNR